MRSATFLLGLSVVVAATCLAACAPSEDDSDQSGQDLSGGSKSVESPLIFLFDAADAKGTAPKCAGALLGAKVAVTAKSCAKQGMVIGRGDKKVGGVLGVGGKADLGKITAVHFPDDADAEIAVVEIDRELAGNPAVITHVPLKDGYAIDSFAAADGSGIFSPDKGQAASVGGRIVSETEKFSALFPNKGQKICAGDLGAPVCSSTGFKILNWNITGTCGLSGLVIGPENAVQASTSTTTMGSAGGNTGVTGGGVPTTTTTTTSATPDANGCSEGAWKVVQLGRYAEFLKKFAADAFKPIVIDEPVLRDFPSAPPGLWGYKSGGTVTQCKITTTKIDPQIVNGQAKLSATVSFKDLQDRAQPFGRFGIAPKSAPTQMRWLPARASATAAPGAKAYTGTFDGVIPAATAGDFIIGFRVSANGGETWTPCDTDGMDNGFDVAKLLDMKVTTNAEPPQPPQATPPSGTTTPPSTTPPSTDTTPQSAPPPASPPSDNPSSDYSDSSDSTSAADDEFAPPTKKKAASGCSAAPSGGSGSASMLPAFGLLLGFAAIARRRRA